MRKDIAPVVIVLDKIPLGEADSEGLSILRTDARHGDRWNGIVLSAGSLGALHTAVSEDCFVDSAGLEGVFVVELGGKLPILIESAEGRNRRCRAVGQ